MLRGKQKPRRSPMIHIRLDEGTLRKLIIRVAHDGTTIQRLVALLIRRELDGSTTIRERNRPDY